MRTHPFNNTAIPKFYPRLIQEANSPRVHGVLAEMPPIGRDKLLWDITYPLEKPDITEADIISNFSVTLSTIKKVVLDQRTSEEFGEQIVSQFIFPGYYALMFTPKNAYGMLAYPILQLECRGKILLSIKVRHKKFTKAFERIHALVLQQYCNGGQKLQEVNAAVAKYVEQHVSEQDLKEVVKHQRTPMHRQQHNMSVSQKDAQQQFLKMVGHAA